MPHLVNNANVVIIDVRRKQLPNYRMGHLLSHYKQIPPNLARSMHDTIRIHLYYSQEVPGRRLPQGGRYTVVRYNLMPNPLRNIWVISNAKCSRCIRRIEAQLWRGGGGGPSCQRKLPGRLGGTCRVILLKNSICRRGTGHKQVIISPQGVLAGYRNGLRGLNRKKLFQGGACGPEEVGRCDGTGSVRSPGRVGSRCLPGMKGVVVPEVKGHPVGLEADAYQECVGHRK